MIHRAHIFYVVILLDSPGNVQKRYCLFHIKFMNYSCKIIVHWWTERRKVSVLTWNVGFTQCKILRYKVTAHQTKGLSGFPPFPPSSGWALWSSGQSLRSIGCNRWGDQVALNITDIFRGWKFDILTWPLWQRPLQYLSLVLHLVGHTLGQAPLHSVQLDQPQPVLAPDTSVLIIVLNIKQKIFTLH